MKPKFEKDEIVEAEVFKGFFLKCKIEEVYKDGTYAVSCDMAGDYKKIYAVLPSKYIKKLGGIYE